MKQWVINIILFGLAIIAILIALLKVTPFEVTEGTYIGVIITLLSIVATFVIGYQIYNAIEFKKEISNQKKRFEVILQKNKEIDEKYHKQNYQMQEGFDILSALTSYNERGSIEASNKVLQSFQLMHRALISSIETDRTDYEFIFDYLRLFITELNYSTFSFSRIGTVGNYRAHTSEGTSKPLQKVLDSYLSPIKEDENKIRSSQNFCKIQSEYNRVMKLFYERVQRIAFNPGKPITPEENEKIKNPM